jgi:hypothetical protein
MFNSTLDGWYLGFTIAFVLIEAIVILVAVIVQLARRIARQAGEAAELIRSCAQNTRAIGGVNRINEDTTLIVQGMTAVREKLR